MTQFNKILTGILVVQILLGVVIFLPRSGDDTSQVVGETLVAELDPNTINEIRITGPEDDQITLARDEFGNWVLPEMDDFPVQTTRVTTLLSKLQAARTNRLISQLETSHRRLKVSEEEFVRFIELTQENGDVLKIYLGSNSGGNTIHARLDGASEVYLIGGVSTQDAATRVNSWIEATYFSTTSTQIVGVTLQNEHGEFEFVKDGETWSMEGLGDDEQFNESSIQSLLTQVSTIRMTEPIGKTPQDEFGLDEPKAIITLRVMEEEAPETLPTPTATSDAGLSFGVTTEPSDEPTQTPAPSPTPTMVENVYTIEVGVAMEEGGGVVIKSSESEYYVLIAATTAGNFTDKEREAFLLAPTPTPTLTATPEVTETPEGTLEPEATEESDDAATEEATEESDDEATEEPTESPTEEPTAEPTESPTEEPTAEPTESPTEEPTAEPTESPTEEPTAAP